jgi:cytochrome P450
MTVADPIRPDIDFALHPLPDLYEILDELRAHGPVVPILFATRPLWMVQGFEVVKQTMGDETHTSSAAAYKRSLGRTMGPVMATMSGAEHRKNRGVISAVFFPKPMQALVKPVFTVEADELCDELEATSGDDEPVDLMRAFSRRYTFNIITRLLGLPVTDVERLMGWADAIMSQGWDFEAAMRAKEEIGGVPRAGGPRTPRGPGGRLPLPPRDRRDRRRGAHGRGGLRLLSQPLPGRNRHEHQQLRQPHPHGAPRRSRP